MNHICKMCLKVLAATYLNLSNCIKGAYIYYVITLGGGVEGPGSLDYIDYALRGGGGGKHQNDYVLHDYFCTTNIQSC